jgi:rare lipoprotein A
MMRLAQRLPVLLGAAFCVLSLSACSETQFLIHAAKRLAPPDDTTTGGRYKVGNPYQIYGVWYYPKVDYNYVETGIASWYGPKFNGKRTANGEIFDQNLITAAHRTLPLPSLVRVTNLDNGRSIKVKVNDRGPFAHSRIIDMSRKGAQLLGFQRRGTAKVRVEILAEESRQFALEGARGVQLAQATNGNDVPPKDRPPVTAAPRGTVTQAPLNSPAPKPAPNTTAPKATDQQVVQRPPTEEVIRVPVEKTNMYIQAGAFSDFDNANRLRARLAVLGPTRVSQLQLGNQTYFRVRVGPVRSLKAADAMLERVIRAGHPEARLIVDR